MKTKIMFILAGVCLLYLGIKVFITGGYYAKGVYTNYGDFKITMGWVYIFFVDFS